VRGLGQGARRLRLPVELRVVHGDRRVGREAGDQALVALVEEPGVGMSEEEPAEELAGVRAHRRREIAARGPTAGRHLLERQVWAIARVAGEVVAARDGTEERRSEGARILEQGEVD